MFAPVIGNKFVFTTLVGRLLEVGDFRGYIRYVGLFRLTNIYIGFKWVPFSYLNVLISYIVY